MNNHTRKFTRMGAHIASTVREPISEVWGEAPRGVQGQSPWSGIRRRNPLKLEAFLTFMSANEAQLVHFYAITCSNILFETEYCCISAWNQFTGRHIVTKVKGSQKPESLGV